jgi:hypothetical protein
VFPVEYGLALLRALLRFRLAYFSCYERRSLMGRKMIVYVHLQAYISSFGK